MFQKINNQRNNKSLNLSIINQNNNTIPQDSSLDYSFHIHNHSSISKNNNLTPLENNNSISRTFLNSYSTICKRCLNRHLNNSENDPEIHQNLINNKIKLFDRPIYNFIFPEISKNSQNRQTFNCLSNQIKLDNKNEKKNKFNNLFFHIKSKRKKFDSILTHINKRNKNIEYFPKLLDLRSSSMINKKNDKYKDKNILFIKLKDLNFETEIRNTTRKNFITPDKYLLINTNNNGNFLEKKTTYKILENIKFKFKNPIDKSKLQKYAQNFKSFYAVNKFY